MVMSSCDMTAAPMSKEESEEDARSRESEKTRLPGTSTRSPSANRMLALAVRVALSAMRALMADDRLRTCYLSIRSKDSSE